MAQLAPVPPVPSQQTNPNESTFVPAQDGVTSVTTGKSCSSFASQSGLTWDCLGTATELNLEFTVGTSAQTFTYDFIGLLPADTHVVGGASCAYLGGQDEQNNPAAGQCLVPTPLKVTVEVSPLRVYYQLQLVSGATVMFTKVGLHTKAGTEFPAAQSSRSPTQGCSTGAVAVGGGTSFWSQTARNTMPCTISETPLGGGPALAVEYTIDDDHDDSGTNDMDNNPNWFIGQKSGRPCGETGNKDLYDQGCWLNPPANGAGYWTYMRQYYSRFTFPTVNAVAFETDGACGVFCETFSPCDAGSTSACDGRDSMSLPRLEFNEGTNTCCASIDVLDCNAGDDRRCDCKGKAQDFKRGYCGIQNQRKYEQLNNLVAGRVWSGDYTRQDLVYKCTDSGGDPDDVDNTGFDPDCLAANINDLIGARECFQQPLRITSEGLIGQRGPLQDDCDTETVTADLDSNLNDDDDTTVDRWYNDYPYSYVYAAAYGMYLGLSVNTLGGPLSEPGTTNAQALNDFLNRPESGGTFVEADDDDVDRMGFTNGPFIVADLSPTIIGCNQFMSLLPNGGGKHVSNTPGNIRPPPRDEGDDEYPGCSSDNASNDECDDIFCGSDDENCATSTSVTGDEWAYADCPAEGCIAETPSTLFQNNAISIPDALLCSGSLEGDLDDLEIESCKLAFPFYFQPRNYSDDDASDANHPGLRGVPGSLAALMNDPAALANSGASLPRSYYSFPFTICSTCNLDRLGLWAFAQQISTGGDGPNVVAYGTHEGMSELGPAGSPYTILEEPIPIVVVEVTIEADPDGPAEFNTTTFGKQSVSVSNNAIRRDGGGPHIGDFALSNGGNVAVKLNQLRGETGQIGTNLEGMIVIMNTTNMVGDDPTLVDAPPVGGFADDSDDIPTNKESGSAEQQVFQGSSGSVPTNPPTLFNMGLGQYNLVNPWPSIINGTFNPVGLTSPIVTGAPVGTDNSGTCPSGIPGNAKRLDQLPGWPPLPEVLLGLPGVPPYSWFYYVAPSLVPTYHAGCRGMYMRPSWFSNQGNAILACSRPRYGCVANWIEGYDFTVDQRYYDSDQSSFINKGIKKTSGNRGMYERMLRDTVLTEFSPCVVSSYYFDLVNPDFVGDPATWIAYAEQTRHILPNWATENSNPNNPGLEPPPWYIAQDFRLVYEDPTLSGILSTTVMVADAIFIGDVITVSTGTLVDSGSDFCSVQQGTDTGQIEVEVQNTDAQNTGVAQYVVQAQCQPPIQVLGPSQTLSLSPQQIATAFIPIGFPALLNNAQDDLQCTLKLGTPAFPGVVFSQADITCTTFNANHVPFNVSAADRNACEMWGENCGNGKQYGPGQWKESTIATVVVTVLAIVGFLFLLWIWTCMIDFYGKSSAALTAAQGEYAAAKKNEQLLMRSEERHVRERAEQRNEEQMVRSQEAVRSVAAAGTVAGATVAARGASLNQQEYDLDLAERIAEGVARGEREAELSAEDRTNVNSFLRQQKSAPQRSDEQIRQDYIKSGQTEMVGVESEGLRRRT